MSGGGSLTHHLGEPVILLSTMEGERAQGLVLIGETPQGVICANPHRRLLVSYKDLATRRYKLIGSDAARAVMHEARRRVTNPGA